MAVSNKNTPSCIQAYLEKKLKTEALLTIKKQLKDENTQMAIEFQVMTTSLVPPYSLHTAH